MVSTDVASKRRKIKRELSVLNKQIDTIHNSMSLLDDEAAKLKQKALEKMHQLNIIFDKE